MGVGSSKGAFYEDEFRAEAAPWFIDPKKEDSDNNVIDPDVDHGSTTPLDNPVIRAKDKMPFPDNRNPDAEFNSRFGDLPPSGILNDLKKPKGETLPLARKINYLGEMVDPSDDLSWDRTEAIGRRNSEGKVEYFADPNKLSKEKLLPGEESYTLPDNPHLWIRKSKPKKPSESDLIS